MRFARLAVLPLALLAATASAEDPAPLHDLTAWRPAWTKGASRTVTANALMQGTVTVDMPDEETGGRSILEQNLLELDEYVYVQRCDGVDAGGAPTSFRVFVTAWKSQDQEEGPDESLAGVHLEVTVKDGAYSWKALNLPTEPSRLAKEWLDKRFGAERNGDEGLALPKLGLPPGPLPVGGTWKGKLTFLEDDMPVDPAKSAVDLTLASVKDGVARIPVKVRLQLKGFPLGDAADAPLVPWVEGGALEGQGETVVALGGGSLDASNVFEGGMTGKAQNEQMTIGLDAAMTGKVAVETGGTIPEMTPVDPVFKTQPVR
jgi:hypothetical protein